MTSLAETQAFQSPNSYHALNRDESGLELDLELGPNSIPPSKQSSRNWEEEIVPALRSKLKQQSQTLDKRLSRIQSQNQNQNQNQGNFDWNRNDDSQHHALNRDGNGRISREEMDNRFISNDKEEDFRGIAVMNGNKKQKSVTRNGPTHAATSTTTSTSTSTGTDPSSTSQIHDIQNDISTNSHLEPARKVSKKNGRKTEPYNLGYRQPSTLRNQSNMTTASSDFDEADLANQTFPSMDVGKGQGFYDPEEEPAGVEARKEFRIRTQSQPLAIRNSAAKDRARKLQLEKEREKERDGRDRERDGDRDRERERERDRGREYPPSSSKNVYQDDFHDSNSNPHSHNRKGPRKVPSLGDARMSNPTSNFHSSKIPRPIRRDSENSRQSVRSEREDQNQSSGLRTDIARRNGAEENGERGDQSGTFSSDFYQHGSGFVPSSQSNNEMNSNPSTRPRNHPNGQNSNSRSDGVSRSHSRKKVTSPTKEELEEFGPLGGNPSVRNKIEHQNDYGMNGSKKFATAPSGLSSMMDPAISSSRNQPKSSDKSLATSFDHPDLLKPQSQLLSPSQPQPGPGPQLGANSSSSGSFSAESLSHANSISQQERDAEEDLRNNFYTIQQAKKWDDQLLPVVAKRLQAEAMRNARLSQFEGFIDTYDRNGLPLSYQNWNGKENEERIEKLLRQEEELKRGKKQEMERLERENLDKKQKNQLLEKRNSLSVNRRDANNEIEMQRLDHEAKENQARKSQETARKLVREDQERTELEKRKQDQKKKKAGKENEAGCCQCSIM